MKVSVLLPGNSANTVCMTSEKGKVARQQQVVRQAGVIHETEQDYKLTLQRNHAQRLINENEEQRNLRLQRLRESQSIRKEMELRGQIVVLSSGGRLKINV